jgi:stage II sporulation protein P
MYINNFFKEKSLNTEQYLFINDYEMSEYIINSTVPIMKVSNDESSILNIKNDILLKRIEKLLFNINFNDLKSIIESELHIFAIDNQNVVSVLADVSDKTVGNIDSLQEKEDVSEEIKSINDILNNLEKSEDESELNENIEEVTIKSINGDNFVYEEGLYIKNETTKSIDIGKMLKEKIRINPDKNGPIVLIVHTHTSEAYTPTKENYYIESDPDRTEDERYNIVRVGGELAQELEKLGVQVLHDKTCHDYPSYNGSYRKSLSTITNIIEKYPSICLVLDIHRDAFELSNGKKLKVATTINERKVAQIMQVIGTDELGLEHKNWHENLKFALHLQKNIVKDYAELARPINLREERFNQHVTYGSLIIEIGSNGNTLEEALESCKYLADAISVTINQIKEGEI